MLDKPFEEHSFSELYNEEMRDNLGKKLQEHIAIRSGDTTVGTASDARIALQEADINFSIGSTGSSTLREALKKSTISVYLEHGAVYEYETTSNAREHVFAIIQTGYRTVDEDGVLTHWPPHKILKVEATNCDSQYEDRVRGT